MSQLLLVMSEKSVRVERDAHVEVSFPSPQADGEVPLNISL